MKIYYDDTKQNDFIDDLRRFVYCYMHDTTDFIEYDYGTDRVQYRLFMERLREFADFDTAFVIGKNCTHAHGIGNNNEMPVYFRIGEDKQICAYLYVNISPFGSLFMGVTDYDGNLISPRWEIGLHGIRVKE